MPPESLNTSAGRRIVALIATVVCSVALSACGSDTKPTATPTSAADGSGSSTTASAGGSLEGRPWQLATAGGLTIPPGVTMTANFEDGSVSGSSGCNTYSGGYTANDGELAITGLASTQIGCAAPVLAAETAYLKALEAAKSYTLPYKDKLDIATSTGGALHFDAQELSVVGSNDVVSYLKSNGSANVSVIAGTTVTANFADDGTVSGNSGCNNYSGTYETTGTAISIGALGGTKKLCSEPEGVMEQEHDVLVALQSAKRFMREGNQLVLLDGQGRRAVQLTAAG